MKKVKDDGGYAFPCYQCFDDNGDSLKGMTLRDYFAAKAMQAFLDSNPNMECNIVSAWAYDQADAMLEARSK
jgi:hypothetical protein